MPDERIILLYLVRVKCEYLVVLVTAPFSSWNFLCAKKIRSPVTAPAGPLYLSARCHNIFDGLSSETCRPHNLPGMDWRNGTDMARQVDLTDELPPELLVLLGRLLVNFGQIEYLLQLSIKRLSGKGLSDGLRDAERLVNLSELCEEAQRLFEQQTMDQGLEGDFRNIITCVKNLNDMRPNVIHGFFGVDQATSDVILVKNRKQINISLLDEILPLQYQAKELLEAYTARWKS